MRTIQPLKNKIPVGVIGATGMVGQKFVTLLEAHPWFEVACVAASARSAGKSYADAVGHRWTAEVEIPEKVRNLKVYEVETDLEEIARQVSLVFSALSMDKAEIRKVEEVYAEKGIPVVSNNSAHRWTKDVPMIIPEINPYHLALIDVQRSNRDWDKGFIVVKPNCSIQSYVPALEALKEFEPLEVIVSTYQAVSGAGRTFDTWPEMVDNVIPFIAGEEEKSEDEPLKIWAKLKKGKLELATKPKISATCVRIPVSDGHMATVSVRFKIKPSKEQILKAWENFQNPLKDLNLPSAPREFIKYFEEEDRPQTALDRGLGGGMSVSLGRLREDNVFGWKFVALSHNTIRGAAGGAILVAELLKAEGYL